MRTLAVRCVRAWGQICSGALAVIRTVGGQSAIAITISQSEGVTVHHTSACISRTPSRWALGICRWPAAAILATAFGQQAVAADFFVHDTGDPLANGVALVGAIHAAMSTPEEDDRVLLDPGAHYALANPDKADPSNGLPVITSGITLRGGYNADNQITTIERQHNAPQFRILQIQPNIQWVKQDNCTGPEPHDFPPTVSLEYLQLSNGDISDIAGAADTGGGILNLDGRLFLYRSKVTGNHANAGGGIANEAYVLTYENHCFGTTITEARFSQGSVSIQESSIHGNRALMSGGGAVNGSDMRIDHSTIDANQGDEYGGGIINGGTLEISNSTISGNSTLGTRPGSDAAGIHNSSGRLAVSFSTVAFNQGAGIANQSGSVTLSDTILAGNVVGASRQAFDCSGVFTSRGHNLIGFADMSGAVDPLSACTMTAARGDQIGSDPAAPIDAKLAPLAANGGFTQTHALLAGSPAINRANSASSACPMDDQRGIIRRRFPADACDVGPFEKGESGNCGLNCSAWTIVSICARNPYACQKLILPKIEKLPQIPNCLLDGPGCGPLPPLDFQ